MATYRIQLADGEKNLKTDLRAVNEDSARNAAEKWFDARDGALCTSAGWQTNFQPDGPCRRRKTAT